MMPISEQIDLNSPCPDIAGEAGGAPQDPALRDSLFWRQVRAAGLEAVAETIAADRDLELGEAIALSRVSLPLLGKLVELRPLPRDAVGVAAADALPVDRAASLPQLPKNIGQPLTDWDTFCRKLIATRDDRSSSLMKTWYPVLAKPLDQDLGCNDDFSGVEVLRAIALARLILPAEVEVRAPLALLGPKLAQVALDFGASHLGCVALDGETPNDPLVADARIFDELLGSCLPTALKEET